jgi:hypothetical protein
MRLVVHRARCGVMKRPAHGPGLRSRGESYVSSGDGPARLREVALWQSSGLVILGFRFRAHGAPDAQRQTRLAADRP